MDKLIKNLTIIIPAFNEEASIGEVVEKCRRYSEDVIVVDGHSPDKTASIAQQNGARVVFDNKKGKGDAMKQGVLAALNSVIIFIDADGSHDVDDIPKMVEKIKAGYDLVVASRMLGGSDELHGTFDNIIRSAGSGLMAVAINWRWRTDLTDILNGFRGIKKDIFLQLNLKQNGFLIEHEMIVDALKKKFKVGETPSHEYERKGGRSKLPTSQGWKFVIHFIIMMITK
jgi:dolichol-phosphate hexosyltransferase